MASRTRAIAAVNGDYFGSDGAPESTTIIEGNVYKIDAYPRTTLAFSNSSSVAEIGIWTSQAALPNWVYNAISGGPTILVNGQYEFNPYGENFPPNNLQDKLQRQPRTGAALSQDRSTLVIAVVDGRRPDFSVGM